MLRCRYSIQLEIVAPFLSQSSNPGAYGFDTLQARDSEGKILLPGSLVTGRLREAWEELSDVVGDDCSFDQVPTKKDITSLLGTAPEEGSFEPQRKQLFFSDFQCITEEKTKNAQVRSRIAVDQKRGAVAKGAHIMIEYPFLSGETLTFTGSVRFDAENENRAKQIVDYLRCGLQWIPQFGAFSSTGFGELRKVSIDDGEIVEITKSHKCAGMEILGASFAVIFRPESPFCFAKRPAAGNIFMSRSDIPGGAIKGALAITLQRCLAQEKDFGKKNELSLLQENLHFIRFSHAFPSADEGKRPVQSPLSLVKAEQKLYDIACTQEPLLIDGSPPAFQVDWKERADVDKEFGWPEIKTELRVRTAIDRTNKRHLEGSLFASELIVPAELSWLGHVDGSQLNPPIREKVMKTLATLLSAGVAGLGKTKSFARCRLVEKEKVSPAQATRFFERIQENVLIITLQTSALLLDPKELNQAQLQPGALKKAYTTVWDSLGCNLLRLKRFYARQSLSGGTYQSHRFQQGKENAVRPFLLTEPGSVFVLEYSQENRAKVKEKVAFWQQAGLPLADPVRNAWGFDDQQPLWQQCPFLPENGYGEIAVNLEVHFRKNPEKSIVAPIPAMEVIYE